ncbi:GntR family transcriptional regulator [Streptomyces xiamenensis]|uniref:GntR family transcriptional regulator n=1 Tax=Streptomyces xiamenensis TaxID=408015 RepID=UPI0037D3C281
MTTAEKSRCGHCESLRRTAESARRRTAALERLPAHVRESLLGDLAAGVPLSEVCQQYGVTTARLHSLDLYLPGWSQRLDDALTAGRDPDLPHGSEDTYRHAKCRCPDCRAAHGGRRTADRAAGRDRRTRRQVAADIWAAVQSGEGTVRLPAVSVLMTRHAASRSTILGALELLAEQFLIVKSGRGWRVRDRAASGEQEKVLEEVRAHIARAGLRPGDYLPTETALAGALQQPRTVVRQALGELETAGLLEHVPHRPRRLLAPIG